MSNAEIEHEPPGGNVYRPHRLMINSGQFWRCAHGNTGMDINGKWIGCGECAEVIIQKQTAEIERLQALADERGRRMVLLRDWKFQGMETYEDAGGWGDFVAAHPEAADWFTDTGTAK